MEKFYVPGPLARKGWLDILPVPACPPQTRRALFTAKVPPIHRFCHSLWKTSAA